MASSVLDYVKSKGWQYKPDGHNLKVRICPFCKSNKWKFSVHAQRGVFRCWRASCDERGTFSKLRRHLGDSSTGPVSATRLSGEKPRERSDKIVPQQQVDKAHKKLLRDHAAIRWLRQERGFSRESIEHFNLGLRTRYGKRWLCIPHTSEGRVVNVKQRSLPPADKMFMRIKGHDSVLFNSEALQLDSWIVVCEAELDAISLWQAGVKNVVSFTAGAGSFLPEWYDELEGFEKVVLVFDSDAAGQSGARDVARRLGFDRCWNVMLPLHDANDVLANLGEEVLRDQVLTKAEQFEVHGIVHASDALRNARNASKLVTDEGLRTPWPDVDAVMPTGCHPGDLIVLGAPPKRGKTTLAMQWAWDAASRQDCPALFYCLEMHVWRLSYKLAGHMLGLDYTRLTHTDMALAMYRARKAPFWWVEPKWTRNPDADQVFDKIREAVRRYGVRFLVFDNLHYLCRSLEHVNQEVGRVTRGFKNLSEELGITTCLIAQPRKIEGDRPMKANDLRDSSSIPADADTIILMHREMMPAGLVEDDLGETSQRDTLMPETLVRVDAHRFGGGGEAWLWYLGERSTFLPIDQAPERPTIGVGRFRGKRPRSPQ